MRLAAPLLLAASTALAQTYTVQPPIAQTYAPLVGATAQIVSESDDGFVTIPLGFTFPYYGNNYTAVHANTNGFLAFGTQTSTCELGFGCYNGDAIPSATRSTNIHNLIAPWWDDLSVSSPGVIRSRQSAGQIEIEYAGVRNLGSSYTMSFTVKLSAAGTIEIRYGTLVGTGASATVGFENLAGNMGSNYLGCSAVTSSCLVTHWPANTLYVIGQPVQADIVVAAVNIAGLVVDAGGNISFNVTPTFQNYGQTATPAFGWKAYLSTDKVLGGTDVLVHTAPATVTLTGAGTAGASAMASGAAATASAPVPGQYYVLVEADPAPGTVTEASELNNVGSTANYFVSGLDLVATGVSGPASSGPGNPMVVNAKWFNQGTAAAPAPVAYRVLLSLDAMASTTDFTLYSGTRAISGGQTVDENLAFNVPNNVPGGDFFYLLQIDPLNAIAEASETNNTFVSAGKVTMKQSDLVNVATDFLDPVTAGPTRLGYFGQPARATVRIDNVGGANANNFKVGVIVSTDATLSLLSDTIVFEANVPLVAQGASVTVDIPFTLPLKDRNNVTFPTGSYYLFTILDSTSQVTELNEANNNLVVMGQVQLRAPAADLTVTRLEAAASGAVGEVIPVLRTLKNLGNVDSPAVKYRFYASANAIITPDDVPLQIITGAAAAAEGTVTLAIGAADTQTELVRLPASMAPGVYYLGCIIDTGAAVLELDESNNALASNTVQIAASSLRISTQQLPDAIVERPYSYRLVALGEQGPSTWSLDISQGPLPMGMTLGTDGLVSGVPTGPIVSAFTAVVSNNGRDATARLVLRVLPTTTQVEITTTSLPPVFNATTQKYEFSLGAAGGVKPYAWRLLSGALPQSLALSNDGIISGFPRVALPEGVSNVVVEVQDSLGTRAQKPLSVRVIAPGSIVFKNLNLPDGLVGEDYGTDLAIANADLSALSAAQKPLAWSRQGELPDGLTMAPAGDVLSIEGKPRRAGTFFFTITVEDVKGRSDIAQFRIRVAPARFKLSSVGLPEVSRPGEPLTFSIIASSNSNPQFAVYSGQLAPGLTMAADGKVSGTLPADGSEGTFNFVVEAKDDTGATGLGAFTMEVKRLPKAAGCGCSSGGVEALWLLALLLPFVRRQRA